MADWLNAGWMQTYTGRKYTPFDPHPNQIDILDIAHSLAMTCRFNGHSKCFYSVAQHSVLMAEKAPAHLALRALLHDAPEAYVGDLVRPIKSDESMAKFHEIEDLAERAICAHFNLPYPLVNDEIKDLDTRILLDERDQVMAPQPEDWGVAGEPLGVRITPWPPDIAKTQFIAAFNEYSRWTGLLDETDRQVGQLRTMAKRMRGEPARAEG